GDEPESSQRLGRDAERQALWQAIAQAQTTAASAPAAPSARTAPDRAASAAIPAEAPVDDVIDYVGRTPAPLVLLPLEDLLGLVEQPNLPGTTSSAHPNWRRRLSVTVEELCEQDPGRRRLDILAQARAAAVTKQVP